MLFKQMRKSSAVTGWVVALMVIAAAGMMLTPTAASAGGGETTYYVSSDTGNDGNAGTEAAPYATIFKAMQSCASGDTIQLYACTNVWSESVVVTKDTVAIVGMRRDSAVIRPPAGADGIYAANRTALKIRTLTVMNVTGTGDGIEFSNTDRSEISGCRVYNAGGYGIQLNTGSDTNMLFNNLLDSQTSNQVRLGTASNYNHIDSNLVRNGGDAGIYCASVDSNVITNNRIENNAAQGIYLSSADRFAITGNYVYNCRLGTSGNGLYISSNSDTNYVYNNGSSQESVGDWRQCQASHH
ncbi:MAG TPA: right-handed parallel beta-helix repeat-containing protein, partial [bacterium]|nr:right-handed parallel beta-helix repeat-containing protein [bacterium]